MDCLGVFASRNNSANSPLTSPKEDAPVPRLQFNHKTTGAG